MNSGVVALISHVRKPARIADKNVLFKTSNAMKIVFAMRDWSETPKANVLIMRNVKRQTFCKMYKTQFSNFISCDKI